MPAELLYRQRLKVLRAIFAEDVRRDGEAMSIGGVSRPTTEAELAGQNEHMKRYLRCTLPACYADVLREFGGMGTMGSVLYGIDEPTDADAGSALC